MSNECFIFKINDNTEARVEPIFLASLLKVESFKAQFSSITNLLFYNNFRPQWGATAVFLNKMPSFKDIPNFY